MPGSRATSRSCACWEGRSRWPGCAARASTSATWRCSAPSCRPPELRAGSKPICSRRCRRRICLRSRRLRAGSTSAPAKRCCCCRSCTAGARCSHSRRAGYPPSRRSSARWRRCARSLTRACCRRASTSPSCAATTITPARCSTRIARVSAARSRAAGATTKSARRSGGHALRPASRSTCASWPGPRRRSPRASRSSRRAPTENPSWRRRSRRCGARARS